MKVLSFVVLLAGLASAAPAVDLSVVGLARRQDTGEIPLSEFDPRDSSIQVDRRSVELDRRQSRYKNAGGDYCRTPDSC